MYHNPQRREHPTCPITDCETTTSAYHRDLWTADVPLLLRQEFALRRQFAGRQHPGKDVAERLAAVECALARGGGER